jgi:uncharacterized YccA/Bax inhibitor family protein
MMESALKRMQVSFPSSTTAKARFDGVLGKLAILVAISIVSGAIGWQTESPALYLPALALAFGMSLVGTFKPHLAKKIAPFYAVCQGYVLGGLSAAYANIRGGIVPTAVVATSAMFIGCYAVHKAGIVKVTPRFAQITMVASFAFFGLVVASLLGLPIPGARDLGPQGMLFGAIGLGVGLMNLFVDFERARKVEEGGMAGEVEWYAAFQLMLSLVMVYVNVLRILGSAASRR